jgi:hypothetical protein
MEAVTLGELRKLTLWPSVGSVLLLVWVSIVGVLNKYWVDGLEWLQIASINIYIWMGIAALLTWSFASSLRTFRSMKLPYGTFAYRYLRVCKVVAFALVSVLVFALVLYGFINFVSSFTLSSSSGPLVDRAVTVYVPLIMAAVMVFYGIYVGFMSKKEAK